MAIDRRRSAGVSISDGMWGGQAVLCSYAILPESAVGMACQVRDEDVSCRSGAAICPLRDKADGSHYPQPRRRCRLEMIFWKLLPVLVQNLPLRE